MLIRHILGYGPSNIVPGIVSFVSLYIFTRLVTPAVFGTYSLVLSIGLFVQTLFFYWVQVGATRFVPKFVNEGRQAEFLKAVHSSLVISAVVFSVGYAVSIATLPLSPHVRAALWLGLPLALARSWVNVSQAIDRAFLRVFRYNVFGCGQAILGLLLSWIFVRWVGWSTFGMLLGLIAGSLAVALPAVRSSVRALRAEARASRDDVRILLGYGLPLTAYFAMGYILSSSDRILIEYFLGSGPVGLYSAAYTTVDRTIASASIMVSAGAFPLAIHQLEQNGLAAARSQLARNGTVLLALVVPICAGLLMGTDQIAHLLIGEKFRGESLKIMPWIAPASLMAGLQVHYFDHAFLLSRRTIMCLWGNGIAVAVNLVINLVFLPRIGIMAAVYATIAAYAVALMGSVVFGRSVFPLPFPWGQFGRIVLSAALMAGTLHLIRFPLSALGFLAFVAVGIVVYGTSAVVLNVGGLRKNFWR